MKIVPVRDPVFQKLPVNLILVHRLHVISSYSYAVHFDVLGFIHITELEVKTKLT